jgi:hypothetical protein
MKKKVKDLEEDSSIDVEPMKSDDDMGLKEEQIIM